MITYFRCLECGSLKFVISVSVPDAEHEKGAVLFECDICGEQYTLAEIDAQTESMRQ